MRSFKINTKKLRQKFFMMLLCATFILSLVAFSLHNINASQQTASNVNINTLFSPKKGESSGSEKCTVANSQNSLPDYASSFTNSGALIYLTKNNITASKMISNAFKITDNTNNDLLLKVRSTPLVNMYQTKIAGTEYESDPNKTITDGILPGARDLKITISDALFPEVKLTIMWLYRAPKDTVSYNLANLSVWGENQTAGAERGDGNLRKGAALGALVSASYWGKGDDFIDLYYDYQSNSIYTTMCDASGKTTGKKLLRNFNSTYGDGDNAWQGFKSGLVNVELEFGGGNATSYFLVTDLDGVNLSTDSDGFLLNQNIEGYNNDENTYFSTLLEKEAVFDEGVKSYEIASLEKTNLFIKNVPDDILTKNYKIDIFDRDDNNITSSTVQGLKDGKWQKDCLFTPLQIGKYKIVYSSENIILEKQLIIKTDSLYVSDLFELETEFMNFSFDANPPNYMQGGKGLKLSLNNQTDTKDDLIIKWLNPIDLKTLNNNAIVEYLITPKNAVKDLGGEEIGEIIITLSEFNNPNSYIKILNRKSNYDLKNSFVSAAASNQNYGNMKQQTNEFGALKNNNGAAITSNFSGLNSLKVQLFYENNKVFVSPDLYSGNKLLIRDFNDPTHLLLNDVPFEGFKTDLVNLTIEFKGVKSTGADVILYSIAGQKLSSEKLVDITAPQISIDKNYYVDTQNLITPIGEKNVRYTIPSAKAFDVIEGDLSQNIMVNVYKNYYTENKTKINKTENYFIPQDAGLFTIEYIAFDSSINEQTELIEVSIEEKLPYLDIVFLDDIVREVHVGDRYYLPEYQIVGGSNKKVWNVTVKNPLGESVSFSNYFLASMQGFYMIEYEVSDYINNHKNKVIIVKSVFDKDYKPVLETPVLPKAVIINKEIVFNEGIALDYYSFMPEIKNAKVDIFINQFDVNYNQVGDRIKLSENRNFIPTVKDGSIKVEYVAYSLIDSSIKNTFSKVIPIINPKTMGEFFWDEFNNVTYDYVIETGKFEKETVFNTALNGATVHFVNKLPSDNLIIEFSKAEKHQLNRLVLVLQDGKSILNTVELTILPKDSVNSYLLINGKGKLYEINGSLISGTQITIKIIDDKYFLDSSNIKVNLFADNEEFESFYSGSIYLAFRFEEVSASQRSGFIINGLLNHSGMYEKINEYVPPILSFEFELRRIQKFYDLIELPICVAYDLMDSSIKSYVTIKDPKGNLIIDKQFSNINYLLKLSMYGNYTITYEAINGHGKRVSRDFNIVSFDDVSPVLEIKGSIKTEYKVNDKIIINELKATDNVSSSEKIAIKTFLIDSLNRVFEINNDYQFVSKGKFIFRIFVEDENKNFVIHDNVINVAERG